MIFFILPLLLSCFQIAFSRSPLQKKFTQPTSMLVVGFEPVIPVFERSKTTGFLDCVVAVIGFMHIVTKKLFFLNMLYDVPSN
jgi:hypothetical protein